MSEDKPDFLTAEQSTQGTLEQILADAEKAVIAKSFERIHLRPQQAITMIIKRRGQQQTGSKAFVTH